MSKLKRKTASVSKVFAVFICLMFSAAVLPVQRAYADDDPEMISDYDISADPDQWYTANSKVSYADSTADDDPEIIEGYDTTADPDQCYAVDGTVFYADAESDNDLKIIADYDITTDPDQWYTTDDVVFYADGILVYYDGEDVTGSDGTHIMFNSVPKDVYNGTDGYYTIPIRVEYYFSWVESTIQVKIVSAVHPGDVSGNGEVDLMDAILISKYILGSVKFDNAQMKNADYNQNGRIDINDVIGIAKYLVGK